MSRPNWDQQFMMMAQVASLRASCSRASVGAVLVRSQRVLCTGYNGSPAGTEHCFHAKLNGEQQGLRNGHCWKVNHAEMNAIAQAAHEGIRLNGSTLYCTHKPCLECSKMLISCGVKRVVYVIEYGEDLERDDLWRESGLEFTHMDTPGWIPT